MRKHIWLIMGLLILSCLLWTPGPAAAAQADNFPAIIPLPNGFRPEGIVTGRGSVIYAGSLANGAIYQADLRTGEGELLFEGEAGRIAVGLSFDERSNYIFAAGGPTGNAYIYDADTGETVAVYSLTDPGTFVNDVVVTRDAAYFTDSARPFLYRLPLLPGGGLPDPSAIEEIPLTGDFEFEPGQFNANGIVATPNGKWLIIVNSFQGRLYRVDPNSGSANAISLGGENVAFGDGLLLSGHTLYVVQNQLNQVAVVELNPSFTRGEVVERITDPNFDVPTTIADFGSSLYVVNARFSTPPTPDTEYDIVKVP